MRLVRIVWLSLALLVALGGVGECSIFSNITNLGSSYVLSMIQNQINGKVSATKISGNPITGVVYQNFTITDPHGKTIVTADRFVLRLSLATVPTFHLDLATVAFDKPHFYVFREKSGQWNISHIVKPAAKPAKPPGMLEKIIDTFLRKIQISNLRIKNGEISITQGGKTTQYSNLNLKSSLTLSNLGKPNEQIKLDVAYLGIKTPEGQAQLETRLAYSTGLARIDFLKLKLSGKTVASVKGEVCRPLTKLSCTLTGKIGPLAGSTIHGFWAQWPAPWDLSGTLSLSSTPTGGKVRVKGKIGRADYAIKGNLNAKVKPAIFNLDLDLTGLTTAQLKEVKLKGFNVQRIQGLSPVNVHLHVKGTGLPWNPASLNGHLELSPFQYKKLKVDKAQLDLSGDAQKQALQGKVAGNFGTVDINAAGHLLPLGQDASLQGNLTVKTRDLKPAMVGVTSLAGTTLTSAFTGKFRLPPGLDTSNLYLAGDLKATGEVKHEPVRDLQARFVLEGRKLKLAYANVQAAGIAASLQGSVSPAALNVTFTATTYGSRALPLPSGSSFRSLRVAGSVRGSFKNPQINLTGRATNVSFSGTSLKSATLNASLSGLPPQSGSLELHGTQLHTKAGNFSKVTVQANGAGGQWQFQATSASPKQPKFELAGTANLAVRPLTIGMNKVSWKSRTLKLKNQAPFQVRVSPGYEISPATFLVDGGKVRVQLLARRGNLSGNITVQHIDASLLAPMGLPATGKINGKATLDGSPAAPIIEAQFSLRSGEVKTIPIQTLTTKVSYQSGEMQVAGYLQAGPQNSRLVWNGTVPVSLSIIPFKFALAQRGLDLKVHSENVNLSLLTLISKQVEEADSKVDMVVQVQGNPHSPKVTGHIRWTAGKLLLKKAGTPYRLEAGEIRLQREKITVPCIMLVSRGTARFSGEATLSGDGRAQVTARLDNFLALNQAGNDVIASGAVYVDGPLTALTANGRITVDKADFRPSFFQSGQNPDIVFVSQQKAKKGKKPPSPSFYKNMTINISIEAPRNLWVKDPMGKVELTAHILITKKPGQEMAYGGEIRALHGSMEAEGKKFKVERAIITLPGVPNKPIIIDARATHEVGDADVKVVVVVNGTITNPQIHLESEPPLPQTDIVSYLAFGAPAATLTKEQYLTFAAQYGILGGAGGNKIGEILGSTIPILRGIKVKTGMVGTHPSVGLEKKVAKNVSLFVTRHLNEERGVYENQAGIKYKFNRHISVESEVGAQNTGADVYFNYDF
jgi:translocation and assembly module TamB